MATWPVSLPDYFIVDGFSESPPENVIRSQTDVGPAKIRRRTTANVRPIKGQTFMRKSQLAVLDTFYTSTLNSGVDAFDWTHPRTGNAVSMRFVEQPVYESLGGTAWAVTLSLEIMP